MAQFNKIDLPW